MSNLKEYKYIESPGVARDCMWICNILFSKVDPSLKARDLSVNLTNFTLPEQGVMTSEIHHNGAVLSMPSPVRETSREIVLDYIMDAEFNNFKTLWKWITLMAAEIGAGDAPEVGGLLEPLVVPVDLYLLSSFKKPILSFKFENAYIAKFGELSLQYQSDNDPLTHSFTIQYSHLKLEDM